MKKVDEIFGKYVFNDKVMRESLPENIYADLMHTINDGAELSNETSKIIAEAMMNWAISLGATHYTHWFQPMTGITAEKHDSFIEPTSGGGMTYKLSRKSLIKGEADASSFPSGGLRATFEARGYTAWDPTSYAFIKDDTLYIPTCFCSYGGEALDKKTPLLKSEEAINKHAMRILKLFGNDTAKKVIPQVGGEQEYFLIDEKIAEHRPDITLCGRTLLGSKPPKGQEMDDHYYGALNERVSAYMKELDQELWAHGVYAKTKHNEVAPAQHELAAVYTDCNTATDHNQLTMDFMKSVARKHGMLCLLHEKPFNAVNGSGKHNNWSIATDTGINLLDPGKTPYENAQFITFLTAVIAAVDKYQDILRASVASYSNDFRLGANEAPPSILSIFLGEEMTDILTAIETGTSYTAGEKVKLELGIHTMPKFTKDTTDRNRTSPFAFTGNKFEFRMVGSSASLASPNIVLNTAVADVLAEFADELENAKDFNLALTELIKRNLKEHKRIIFNGNNYSEEWKKEAHKRGLTDLKTTVDAIPAYISPKNIELFNKHSVFTKAELISRCDILLESYHKTARIECLTLKQMLNKQVIPACLNYQNQLAKLAERKKNLHLANDFEMKMLNFVTDSTLKLYELTESFDKNIAGAESLSTYEKAKFYRDSIVPLMVNAREISDRLEEIFPKDLWPLPSYFDILYSVK